MSPAAIGTAVAKIPCTQKLGSAIRTVCWSLPKGSYARKSVRAMRWMMTAHLICCLLYIFVESYQARRCQSKLCDRTDHMTMARIGVLFFFVPTMAFTMLILHFKLALETRRDLDSVKTQNPDDVLFSWAQSKSADVADMQARQLALEHILQANTSLSSIRRNEVTPLLTALNTTDELNDGLVIAQTKSLRHSSCHSPYDVFIHYANPNEHARMTDQASLLQQLIEQSDPSMISNLLPPKGLLLTLVYRCETLLKRFDTDQQQKQYLETHMQGILTALEAKLKRWPMPVNPADRTVVQALKGVLSHRFSRLLEKRGLRIQDSLRIGEHDQLLACLNNTEKSYTDHISWWTRSTS